MLAGRRAQPFDDDGWWFEVKWDGYRAVVGSAGGEVRARSRRGLDLLGPFPEIGSIDLPDGVVVDGEIVAAEAGKGARPGPGHDVAERALVPTAPAQPPVLHLAVEGTSIEADFAIEGTAFKLLRGVEAQIIRLTQEAVSNAVQHSGATELSVAMRYTPSQLEIVIADNGRGFDHTVDWAERLHFGLLGMKERAAMIGANLTIDSSAGSGTQVSLAVPRAATLTDSCSL